MSDLVGKYRRQVLLDLFGEDASSLASIRESCCDVYSQSKEVWVTDCVKELKVLIDAIDVVGDKGEVKLAQWGFVDHHRSGPFSITKIATPLVILWDTR